MCVKSMSTRFGGRLTYMFVAWLVDEVLRAVVDFEALFFCCCQNTANVIKYHEFPLRDLFDEGGDEKL